MVLPKKLNERWRGHPQYSLKRLLVRPVRSLAVGLPMLELPGFGVTGSTPDVFLDDRSTKVRLEVAAP